MEKLQYKAIAKTLYNAQETKQAIQPLHEQMDMNVIDAYHIQLASVDYFVDKGRVISGKKIGLTSKAMQSMFNVNEPDYGHMFEDAHIKQDAEASDYIAPKVEGEIAFVLKEDLIGPNVTVEEVLKKTDYVIAALEIVDSRIANWDIQLIDTVADNASFGGYCLGEIKLDPTSIHLPSIEMKLYKNGKHINNGSGKDVLGDPVYCVAWLANKMGEFGVTLKKGEVILSGSFSAALPAVKGDKFEAVFTHLGKVALRFK